MKFNNRPNRPILLDGQEVWISRSVTVLPILIFVTAETTYVPLGLRGPGLPNEVGKWGLPGGYLDYDETISDAVVREVWEEMGLNLPELCDRHPWEGFREQPYYVSSQPIRRQNITLRFALVFQLDAPEQLPKLHPQVGTEEVEQARWFTLQEALATDLAFGHDRVIQDYLDHYHPSQLSLPRQA